MKLTPIFPAHIKPVRTGIYKTTGVISEREPAFYSYWDGKQWRAYNYTVESAYRVRSHLEGIQDKRWQGVLK